MQVRLSFAGSSGSGSSRRPARIAITGRVRCGSALQKYVEDPFSEALIQGGIQRPATLQIYVGEEGLAFRPVVEATPVVH
jgi:hypothetical protein